MDGKRVMERLKDVSSEEGTVWQGNSKSTTDDRTSTVHVLQRQTHLRNKRFFDVCMLLQERLHLQSRAFVKRECENVNVSVEHSVPT